MSDIMTHFRALVRIVTEIKLLIFLRKQPFNKDMWAAYEVSYRLSLRINDQQTFLLLVNTIIPDIPTTKLDHLYPQLSLSNRSPQRCLLSPLLYTLYDYDCTPTHPTNITVDYNEDKTAHRR